MKESFATSFILRPPQIESINSDGSNRRTILTAKDRINRPTAMAIMDRFAILSFFLILIPFSFRRLYYLDPQYEKVVRVDLPNGDNPKTLLDNEVKLRTLNIYRKRPLRSNHPCLTNQGGCDHICIPAADNQRTCGCSVGFLGEPTLTPSTSLTAPMQNSHNCHFPRDSRTKEMQRML